VLYDYEELLTFILTIKEKVNTLTIFEIEEIRKDL
jgi:hypothetical protein